MNHGLFERGDRVRWVPPKPCDWAGDGSATVIRFDPSHICCGDDGPDKKGPAYDLKLDHNGQGFTVWVPLDEVMALLEVPS